MGASANEMLSLKFCVISFHPSHILPAMLHPLTVASTVLLGFAASSSAGESLHLRSARQRLLLLI